MNSYFSKTFSKSVAAFVAKSVYRNVTLDVDICNYPKRLYKYKPGNADHDYEMIQDEYLWASSPTRFDDPTDSFVNFNVESHDKDKVVDLLLDNYHNMICHLIVTGKINVEFLPQMTQTEIVKYKKAISSQNRKYSVMKNHSYIRNLKDKQLIKAEKLIRSPKFTEGLSQTVPTALETMTQMFRNLIKICCLTTRKDNQKLWEDFAAMYSGFVIEYDTHKCLGCFEAETALSNTFKVSYRRYLPTVSLFSIFEFWFLTSICGQPGDATEIMENLYKQVLFKKKEYACEEEWRVISYQNTIPFPAINAVYMGYNIAPENENRVKEICFAKGIPLYKQRFTKYSTKMLFDPIRKEDASSERNEKQRN